MENSTDNLYVIDLTYAKSPADVVFELSSVIDTDAAHNQKVFLKLGNVDLNQSQLLSINSLINSINSTLKLVSSDSKQTEAVASALGFLIGQPKTQDEPKIAEKPVAQYVPMTEHLDSAEKELEKAIDGTTEEAEKEFEVSEEKIEEDFEEKMMIAAQKAKEKIFGESVKHFETLINQQKAENAQKEEVISKKEENNSETETSQADTEILSENTAESAKNEDEIKDFAPVKEPESSDGHLDEKSIQDELDSIFDSENKLENIFAEEAKNFPEAKTGVDIEIPEEELTEDDYEILKIPTKYIKQTVRSGQVIKSDGNLMIVGDCHPGSEVHAKGDITVWGALGGIAQAGSVGNKKARIRALQLNAIQLRIADFYARRPDASNIVYVDKSNTVMPEEARIVNDNIVILKLND